MVVLVYVANVQDWWYLGSNRWAAVTMLAIGAIGCPVGARIPDSHRDLIDCPPVAALTTLMPDGSPQTTPVWCEFDGVHVLVNTMRDFLKERNMRRDPRVTLLCYDPANTLRSLEVRGRVVEMTEDGAAEQLDRLGERYTGRPYFSDLLAAGRVKERRCSARSCRSGS